ncbi:MAG TPA: CpsD/CapB family tyrosine-protein kinase [Steroidobacteraceae bacterium]|nr:CpsD/CapB family tyrosine-protein kinase [Steroidobacteraceae bacterium]
MSIIEEAVRKTAEQHHRHGVVEPVSARVKMRRVASSPELATGRRFQPFGLDAQTLEQNHVLPQVADGGALRAYKILRTRVLRRLDAHQWRSMAITGVTAGEGKTLTAINLAMALAQDVNTWVFLVDLDLQRPRVAEYLGLHGANGGKGLSDYLLGDASFESITYTPMSMERLSVIPNFEAIAHSSELLGSSKMLDLMHSLEAEAPRRILVVDMPPVLASDDVLAFAPQLDCALLVVGEGFTSRDSLKRAKEVLAEMNLLGVVLNRSADGNDKDYYSYNKPK